MFLAGFVIFIGSFFFSDFKLTNEDLSEVLNERELSLVRPQLDRLTDQVYGSSIDFISELQMAFVKTNDLALNTYQVSESELNTIISQSGESYPLMFSIETLDKVFDSDNEVDEFKRKALSDYGGWLDQREYLNRESLLNDLNAVNDNISKYAIISQKGLDKYRIKQLKYDLILKSSFGPINENPGLFILLTYGLCILGAIMYILPKVKLDGPPGIRNNKIQFSSMKNKGWLGISTGTFLILFYIILYYFPEYMTNWIVMVDPISYLLKNSPAGRFFSTDLFIPCAF